VDAFNDFFEKTIQKIRAVDRDHIIFVEGDDWGKDFSLFRKLGGDQEAISFHFYPGQHAGLFEDSEQRKAKMAAKMDYFTGLREKTGMPLWVGETGGVFPRDKMAEGLKLVKECLDIFEARRISWTIWTYKDARAMGMVYPKDSTKWMELGNALRPKWQSKEMRSDTVVKEFLEGLEKRFNYKIEDPTRVKLSFRVAAFLHALHTEYLVKPTLRSIPWDEMKEYPKSFLWENCDHWRELADLVKSYSAPAG
jgi:hypothetical protein